MHPIFLRSNTARSRRRVIPTLIIASGLLAGFDPAAAGALAAAQSTGLQPTDATRPQNATSSIEERLAAKARVSVYAVQFNGSTFSGPGWEMLLREGRASEFFLLGEEHGTGQVPPLSRELFRGLQPAGYDKLAIELSPPVADDLDAAAARGLDGIRAYYRRYPPGPAFYLWKDEAELLAAVKSMVPLNERAIWGLDYEVLGDRQLVQRLKARAPRSALPAIMEVEKASAAGWVAAQARGEIQGLLAFSGDPRLIQAVKAAWPSPDRESSVILDTLHETLEINRLARTSNWSSNDRRAAFGRSNFLRLLAGEQQRGRATKALIKMGANHLIRGVNLTGVFDIGNLASEVAAIRGGRSFHLLVGGGANSAHGRADEKMGLVSAPAAMLHEAFGLGFLLEALPKTGLVLLDLRPLRPLASGTQRLRELSNPEAVRIIHGYDAVLIWNGTTPTSLIG